MEAQGEILADYFLLHVLGETGAMREPAHADEPSLFRAVLDAFLEDPSDPRHLPRRLWRWPRE